MILHVVNSGSDGNCYLVRDDNGHYLVLDCGQKVKTHDFLKVCNFDISPIDAVLYTHKHQDHLGHIRDFMGIPLYGCEGLDSSVKVLPERSIQFLPCGWKVVPWSVPHTGNDSQNVNCYAYYIESPSKHRMVYLTDFMYSPMTFKNLKVQTILIACNHDDDIEEYDNSAKFRHILTGHSSLKVVKEIIRANQTDSLRNVILCHLSTENATPVKMLTEIYGIVNPNVRVSIARSGRKINLDER